MRTLHYNPDNHLTLEQIDLTKMCAEYATPFYLYSTNEIRRNCRLIREIGTGIDLYPCYALKANYNPHLIKLIHSFGFGADVVSAGELTFALKSGIPVDQIVFAGVGKTPAELETAIKLGIHSINIESESELNRIIDITQRHRKSVKIAIRVNPDIDPETHPYISTGLHTNKFGIARSVAMKMFQLAAAQEYIIPSGIHVHIGSQIVSREPYLQTARFLIDTLEELKSMNIRIEYVDLGGGIGIHYENQIDDGVGPLTHLPDILPELLAAFKGLKVKIIIELGRSIVGTAGFLVTQVQYIKTTPAKKFLIVDAAMNNLIRPSLYQAFHQILPLRKSDRDPETVDVVGPVCETSDYLARERLLPPVQEGDFLVVTGAGAYGQALASNYNLRPMIPEYLVDRDTISTIYSGETIEQILDRYIW